MDIRKSPVHHVTSSVNGCSLGLIGTWMFANTSRIFVWWRRHKSRALTAPPEKSCYLFPGSAENGTQGLSALPLALPLPFLILPLLSQMCLQGEVCRCSNCTVRSHSTVGELLASVAVWATSLTFPASFLVSIWFDSGERSMLSSLIPANKSPCHHSFPMLL